MDRKSLIIPLVIIIVAAVIAFNFEEFTGQAQRHIVLQESLTAQPVGVGSVSVEPKTITAGDKIYITIKPGDTCIDNEISIYKKDRKLPIVRFTKPAKYKGSSTGTLKYCEEVTIQYKTWNNWEEGDYYVQVKELPMKMTGKIKEKTVHYTDDFYIKSKGSYAKIIIAEVGSLISNPQKVFGQRYIFRN